MKHIINRHSSDNKYLHMDFHILCDHGISYVGNKHGNNAVVELLRNFTVAYHAPLIDRIKDSGLPELKQYIENTYTAEGADDAVKTVLGDDSLDVEIEYCPAVRFMNNTSHSPSKWFIETTRTVYKTIAEQANLDFIVKEYNPQTGKTSFRFSRRRNI